LAQVTQVELERSNTEKERNYTLLLTTIRTLEQRNTELVNKLKTKESDMLRARTVNELKIKERTLLLQELSTQVNDLRSELSRKNITKQYRDHAPNVRQSTAPGTGAGKTCMMVRLDADTESQSMGMGNTRPGPWSPVHMPTVGGPASPKHGGPQDGLTLTKLVTDNQAGWVTEQFARERPVTSSSLPLLRRSTFSASGGLYGALDNPLNSRDGISDRMMGGEEGGGSLAKSVELDLNWLGAKPEVSKEISIIRERLVQHITDAMNNQHLKEKPYHLSGRKNRDRLAEGREIRLKEIQEKKAALIDIGQKAISKHKPKKKPEYGW
jgi:hypothetical protein